MLEYVYTSILHICHYVLRHTCTVLWSVIQSTVLWRSSCMFSSFGTVDSSIGHLNCPSQSPQNSQYILKILWADWSKGLVIVVRSDMSTSCSHMSEWLYTCCFTFGLYAGGCTYGVVNLITCILFIHVSCFKRSLLWV